MQRGRRRLGWGLIGAVAAALAACSSNSSPTPICGAPTGQVVVAYPAPNSTGIPDNFVGVIFASTNGLGSSYNAIVLPTGSSSGITLLPVVRVSPPLPSPNATPAFANPVYSQSASNGYVLPAATSVSVYLNDLNSNCSPRLLSTFTSQ